MRDQLQQKYKNQFSEPGAASIVMRQPFNPFVKSKEAGENSIVVMKYSA